MTLSTSTPPLRDDSRKRIYPGEPQRIEWLADARSLIEDDSATSPVVGALLHGTDVGALGHLLVRVVKEQRGLGQVAPAVQQHRRREGAQVLHLRRAALC